MKLEYKLTGLGWAEGYIQVDHKTCYFTASYLTDALYDCLDSILSIIPSCVPDYRLKQKATFQFYAEPSGTEWSLESLDDGKISVQIISYADLDHKIDPNVELQFHIPLLDFLESLIRELDLLIQTHGLVGYRECWYESDFPLTHFLKLKQFLITQSEYEVMKYEDKGCHLSKTNFETDIQLLLKKL